jgi:hypothetical protein
MDQIANAAILIAHQKAVLVCDVELASFNLADGLLRLVSGLGIHSNKY